MLIHGFSPVNARLLITCDTAFYAIIHFDVLFSETEDQCQDKTIKVIHLSAKGRDYSIYSENDISTVIGKRWIFIEEDKDMR